MVRVLVTVEPTMYREAIALSLERGRPGSDVRITSPEATEAEVGRFCPHLLVHNDTAPVPRTVLKGVPLRVTILYSDSMDVIVSDGFAERLDDASTEDLLGAVDRAAALGR